MPVSPQTESFYETSSSSKNVQPSAAYPSIRTVDVVAVRLALSRIEAAVRNAYSLIAEAEIVRPQQHQAARKPDNKRQARPPNASAPVAAKRAALESSERNRKRNKIEMLRAFGVDEQGREPCYFHHRIGTVKCKFNASACKAGHHNGRARDAYTRFSSER